MKFRNNISNWIFLFFIVINMTSCVKKAQEKAQENEIEVSSDSCKYCSLLYKTITEEDLSSFMVWRSFQENIGQKDVVVLKDKLLYDCSSYFNTQDVKIKPMSSEEIIDNNIEAYFDYLKIQIIGDSAYVRCDYPRLRRITESEFKWEIDQWVLARVNSIIYRAEFVIRNQITKSVFRWEREIDQWVLVPDYIKY